MQSSCVSMALDAGIASSGSSTGRRRCNSCLWLLTDGLARFGRFGATTLELDGGCNRAHLDDYTCAILTMERKYRGGLELVRAALRIEGRRCHEEPVWER